MVLTAKVIAHSVPLCVWCPHCIGKDLHILAILAIIAVAITFLKIDIRQMGWWFDGMDACPSFLYIGDNVPLLKKDGT